MASFCQRDRCRESPVTTEPMCGSRIILTVQRAGYLLSPLRGNQGLNSARTHPQAYWPFRGNNPMWDKVVQFRRQAQDCKERAAGARDPRCVAEAC